MNKELIELLGLEPTEKQIRAAAKKKGKELGWNVEEAIFPVNPLLIEKPIDLDRAVELLKEHARVRKSLRYSVRHLVRDSLWDSLWYSMWGLARDSVRNSVWGSKWGSAHDSVWDQIAAYTSSLFPSTKKWHGIEHEEGVNPFQSGADLWRGGYVATFDGEVWRLHRGKKAKVVWEGEL